MPSPLTPPFNNFSKLVDIIFGIHKNEFRLVLSFLIYLTILITGYVIFNISSITLFVSQLSTTGLHQLLPWIYIGNAFTLLVIGNLYRKYIDRFGRVKLISVTTLFFSLSIIFIRFFMAISVDHEWLYFFILLWNDSLFAMSLMMFYSFLGDYFHHNDAKRLYGFIAGGMAIGAMLAGILSEKILLYLSPQDLLYFAAFILGLSIIMPLLIEKKFKGHHVNAGKSISHYSPVKLKTIFSNPYVRLLLSVSVFSVFATSISTYQLFSITQVSLSTEKVGHFISELVTIIGIAILVIQFLLARIIINTIGIFSALLILPALLIITSSGFLIYPVLLVETAIKLIDGAFTIMNEFMLQTLYVPLSERIRVHSLSVLTGIMMFGARLLSGVTLLMLSFFAIQLRYYAIFILIPGIVWMLCIFSLKKRFYVVAHDKPHT